MWSVTYSKQAVKDSMKIERAGLKKNVVALLSVMKENPFQTPPPYEKLVGDLRGTYSRRINIQHRLVYEVFEKVHMIRIIRMWTHYE